MPTCAQFNEALQSGCEPVIYELSRNWVGQRSGLQTSVSMRILKAD